MASDAASKCCGPRLCGLGRGLHLRRADLALVCRGDAADNLGLGRRGILACRNGDHRIPTALIRALARRASHSFMWPHTDADRLNPPPAPVPCEMSCRTVKHRPALSARACPECTVLYAHDRSNATDSRQRMPRCLRTGLALTATAGSTNMKTSSSTPPRPSRHRQQRIYLDR